VHCFAGLELFEICCDVHYATVDRQLELVGSGRRPVEADDRSGRAATEQDDEHRRTDGARRRFTGLFFAVTLRSSPKFTLTALV